MASLFHPGRRFRESCPQAAGFSVSASRVCGPRTERLALALLLGLGLIAGSSAEAQSHTHKEHKRDYKREIEAVEAEWKTAQLNGDVATMDRLLADDYFGISISGQLNDKMQQLERLRSRTFVLTRLDTSEVRIKLVGRVAIVTSLASIAGTNEGRSIKGNYRYTRVYKRYPDGSWKITNFEVTQVPQG
jgi:ketosteroid isomerase-like protein